MLAPAWAVQANKFDLGPLGLTQFVDDDRIWVKSVPGPLWPIGPIGPKGPKWAPNKMGPKQAQKGPKQTGPLFRALLGLFGAHFIWDPFGPIGLPVE